MPLVGSATPPVVSAAALDVASSVVSAPAPVPAAFDLYVAIDLHGGSARDRYRPGILGNRLLEGFWFLEDYRFQKEGRIFEEQRVPKEGRVLKEERIPEEDRLHGNERLGGDDRFCRHQRFRRGGLTRQEDRFRRSCRLCGLLVGNAEI